MRCLSPGFEPVGYRGHPGREHPNRLRVHLDGHFPMISCDGGHQR